ncbi:MAG TPA: sigma-70 family RNA polymerase sigma factor [Bryobacteraceae bacterium]|jgi:RNA polymerase sigma-70 factor (ECF subfamily)|nr:sigma-70 family RNA polymerase sigma factor [Bryobacteraceae bacterium]
MLAGISDESSARIPLVGAADACCPTPSALEQEVIGLFDEFRGRLLGYLLSMGLSAQDGEDVVQETFLALFQHLREGKSRKNLRGWVFRVAHNLGLRARTRAGRVAIADPELMAARADTQPNPEEQAASGQRQQRLLAVLHALPEQERHCISLRAEGLRYREIAGILGMSLGAVSNSLGRSLARLSRAGER